MTPLRVARIPYLNSVPFYQRLGGEGIELLDLPPRQLGMLAVRGEVDAGILSLCDAFRAKDFEPLGAMGVAVDGPAHSVLLLSRKRPSELEGSTIGITTETSTSFPLLRLLLERCYGVTPSVFARRPSGPEPGDDAVLLIGDQALFAAARAGLRPGRVDYGAGLLELHTAAPWRWALDLAMAWKRWQGLPFVFARWMVGTGVDAEARLGLQGRLVDSLDQSMRDLRSLAAEHAGAAGLQAEEAYAYLMGFTYRLGAPELEAVDRFREMLAGAPWWESSPPLAVARRRT